MNEQQKIWNVPNVLTMIRMALIPVFWYLFMSGYRWWALAVFVTASLTDLADGYIARKYHLITDFGKLMDPLADKLMVVSMMMAWVIVGVLPLLPLVIIMMKETLMVIGSAIMLRKKVVVYAARMGKYAQFVTVFTLGLCYFHEKLAALSFPLLHVLIWIAAAMAVCAFVFYARQCVEYLNKQKQEQAQPQD